ncbi:MAG: hypothetical protein Q4C41_03300 [Eggerthellaceae bacterium]|nr:hypothetical protein [Eggerthellaceae bacterium]
MENTRGALLAGARAARLALAALLAACALALAAMLPQVAWAEDGVARIGETEYATLQSALNQAQEGDTITLLSNVVLGSDSGDSEREASKPDIRKSIMLDLNTKKISGAGYLKVSSGNVSIKNGTVATSAASSTETYGVYVSGGAVTIDNCAISTAEGGDAVYLQDYTTANITNSRIAAPTSGTALWFAWNGSGVASLGAGNVITGPVKFAGNFMSSYMVNIEGGSFDNGETMPFATNNDESVIKERLNLTGGYFKVDVSGFVADGYTCRVSDTDAPTNFDYQVASSTEPFTSYYTVNADNQKTYYDTWENVITAAKAASAVAYTTAEVTIADPASLSGVSVSTLRNGKLVYSGALANLLSGGVVLDDAEVSCSDASVTSAKTAGGKLSSGVVAEGGYDAAGALLADGKLIYGDQTAGEIVPEESCAAKIGSVGYFFLTSAVNAASSNDGAAAQIKDTIVMLKDWDQPIAVQQEHASFTLDMSNHSITASSDYAVKLLASNIDITVKNGVVAGQSAGISSNGMYRNINLELENLTVSGTATDGAALYLAAGGITTATGGAYTGATGIQLCGGSLIVDDVKVTATGQDESAVKTGDGIIPDGAAISVVEREGYADLGIVEIKNGTFTAVDGVDAVKTYAWSSNTASEWAQAGDVVEISGGTFSTEVPEEYCAEGFNPQKNADGTYGVHKHEIVKHDAVASTCVAAGNAAYYECSVCGKLFEDEAGESEIAKETVTIAATGKHSFAEAWRPGATSHWHECSVCGAKADEAEHEFVEVIDKEATATEPGSKHQECKVCGYAKGSEVIPATGSGSGEGNGDNPAGGNTGGNGNTGDNGNGGAGDTTTDKPAKLSALAKTGDAVPATALAAAGVAAAAAIACGFAAFRKGRKSE